MKTVEGLVTIANAPAGQAYFDGARVDSVVAVGVGEKQQIRRGAQPETVEADGDTGGKRNAFGKHFAGVHGAVAVGVLENQDATVAGIGEALATPLIVAILRDPQSPAVVSAERHGLGDHGLRCVHVHRKAIAEGHRLNGFVRRQELGVVSFFSSDAPEDAGRGAAVLAPLTR